MEGQYYSSQNRGLPLSYQYDDCEDLSTQSSSSLRPYAFDNLSRPQLDHRFMNTPPASHLLPAPYGLPPIQTPMSQSSQMWNAPIQCAPSFHNHHDSREDYGFEPSGYITANESDSLFDRGINFGEIPRTIWEQYNPRILLDNNISSFEHTSYNSDDIDIKPNLHKGENASAGVEMDYQSMETSQDYPVLNLSRNPIKYDEDRSAGSPIMMPNDFRNVDSLPLDNPSSSRIPSSSISDDGNGNGSRSREMTIVEGEEQGTEEPYAKLIYRALMSAPDHAMVLQEIYQWFRDNTLKGSSDSKGWMNSIRHNLSMNAAFKKTERKLPGDDTKKSTEWVLEAFAIKDGVQSTTRYRKGNTAKRHQRSETPAPNRQISGRKGGISTKNSLRFRRRSPTSIPRIDTSGSTSIFSVNNHNHHNSNNNSNDASGFGSLRLVPPPQQFRSTHPSSSSVFTSVGNGNGNGHGNASVQNERQLSPLTPPQHAIPYYFTQKMDLAGGMGAAAYDLGFANEGDAGGMRGLEDVQGVQIDDSPVFATNHEMQYHHGFPTLAGHDHHRF